MRFLIPILLLLVSCNTPNKVSISKPDGTKVDLIDTGRIGGRGVTMVKDNGLLYAHYDNNDDSLKTVASSIIWGTFWKGLWNSANKLIDSNKTTDLQNAQVDALGIKASVEKFQIANPPPVVIPTPAP